MSDATEARAIEHPNGKTARLVVFPQTGSQLPITPDEDLIVALDDERKMLWAELEAARRALASPPNGAERDALRWISVEERPIPEKGLVDLFASGSRRTGCYFDHICDEWRSVERGIMVVFKRKGITHWMPLPKSPIDAALTP